MMPTLYKYMHIKYNVVYVYIIYTFLSNENASCVCLHVHANMCTQMQIKTQSSIFKMLFLAVILLLPEPTGSLGLIT